MEEPTTDDRTLDANAVAGMLEALFGADLTAADSRCAACGRQGEVGTLLAYTLGPGVVLRCPACSAPFSSAFAVECEDCGRPLRDAELYGIKIRRT